MGKVEPSAAVTFQPALESLSAETPAGPTVMQRTHERAWHRVAALLKNRLKKPEAVDEALHGVLVLYLREWERTYKQGASESPSTVDRTILDIRRDTVAQILRELGRAST